MTFTLVQRGSWPGWQAADIYLEADAAAAFLTANAAYVRETGRVPAQVFEPVGGLRTVAQVKAMQVAFDTRNFAQMALYNMSTTSRARPSLSSPHLSGECVDVAAADFQWWIDNAGRFGLRRTLVDADDPRHFQYFPGTATAALNVTSLDGDAVTPAVRTTPPMTNTRLIADTTTTPPTFYWLDIGPHQTLRPSQMTQAQANIAAQNIGTLTNVVTSPADVQALLPVLAALTPNATQIAPASPESHADILAAIADLKNQEATYQAALLSKLDGVDEATLATFGLKRI